jgi:hypothetical protein
MSLDELYRVPADWNIAPVGTVVPDYMEVSLSAVYRPYATAGDKQTVTVVVLEHDVVGQDRIGGAAVLRMHVVVALALEHQPDRGFLQIEYQQSEWSVDCFTIAQKRPDAQPPAVG